MNYSINQLEKEAKSLRICLSDWDLNNYPISRKDRQDKLNDLEMAISVLKCVNEGINPFSESASIHTLNLKLCKDNQ